MPKVTFGVKGGAEKEFDGDFEYKGPIPPAGPYTGVLKILELRTNGNNDPMLKGLIVLKAPKGHKNSKYNGYGVWFNQNITDQGAPFVNQFLGMISDGTELSLKKLKKAFWEGGIITEDPLPKKASQSAGNVVKIGNWKSNSPDGTTPVSFIGKAGSWEGQDKLDLKRYLTPVLAEDDYEDEDEEDEDEDETVVETSDDLDESDEDDEDEDDDSDEDDDEDDEEEEEEVVTPIKRAAKKRKYDDPPF